MTDCRSPFAAAVFLEVTGINRIYRVNTNKLAAKYNRALLIVNLPSIAAVLTLLAVTLINDGKPLNIFNYKVNFYILTAAVAVAFFTSLFSAVLTNPVLKGHSKETYIEICGGDMVISQFVESAKCEGRNLCYKILYDFIADIGFEQCHPDFPHGFLYVCFCELSVRTQFFEHVSKLI